MIPPQIGAGMEEDELLTLDYESLEHGQEEKEDVVGPSGELPADPPQ